MTGLGTKGAEGLQPATSPPRPDRIDRTSALPYHAQLTALLLHRIDTEWSPGDALPSEAELGTRYGLSRTVIRQSLDQLVHDERIQKIKGKGAYVLQRRVETPFLQRTAGFFEDMASLGHEVRSRILRLALDTAGPDDVKNLEIPLGDPVIRFDRVRSVDGEPVQISEATLPASRFPGLIDRDLEDRSLYEILARDYHCRPATGRRSIKARLVRPAEADALHLPEIAAVMLVTCVTRDSDGVPFEHYLATYRADSVAFDIETAPIPRGATAEI